MTQTTSEFIQKCMNTHGDRYDYSLTEYKSRTDKVHIKCKVHGGFLQRPYDHINGAGCPSCKADKASFTWEEIYSLFPEESKRFYKYDSSSYTRSSVKMKIICPTHGEFWQKPELHRNGSGCKKCTASGGCGLYSQKFFDLNPDWKEKTGFVYLIEFDDSKNKFFKIGITINYKERMQTYLRNNVPMVIRWSRRDKLYDCFLLEQQILETYSQFKYVPTSNMKESGGTTECFNKEIINELFRIA